jgi:SAM-dependent methyltransferase
MPDADRTVTSYDTLAAAYDWLVPDALLEPQGSVAAFAEVVDHLEPGARVLDCAAGTGRLAVGLALQGFDVVATDASRAMIERTSALAARHGVRVETVVCAWEELDGRGWEGSFEAVFCVGNSLTHAAGAAGRRAALAAMAGVLRDGGLLVVTSRNWERLRERRPGLEMADRLTERDGGTALVVHAWTIPHSWREPHRLEVAVAVLDASGAVKKHGERLTFWPFTHVELEEDLRAAGLTPESSTWALGVERYLVTARGPSARRRN